MYGGNREVAFTCITQQIKHQQVTLEKTLRSVPAWLLTWLLMTLCSLQTCRSVCSGLFPEARKTEKASLSAPSLVALGLQRALCYSTEPQVPHHFSHAGWWLPGLPACAVNSTLNSSPCESDHHHRGASGCSIYAGEGGGQMKGKKGHLSSWYKLTLKYGLKSKNLILFLLLGYTDHFFPIFLVKISKCSIVLTYISHKHLIGIFFPARRLTFFFSSHSKLVFR